LDVYTKPGYNSFPPPEHEDERWAGHFNLFQPDQLLS
jgi:hypothetical protein